MARLSSLRLTGRMEDKAKFRQHVLSRIQYIQSGDYKKTFNTNTATIAYATTGQLPEYREARRKSMCSMIMQLLKERRLEGWARIFKVTSLEFHALYDNSLFESEIWFRTDREISVACHLGLRRRIRPAEALGVTSRQLIIGRPLVRIRQCQSDCLSSLILLYSLYGCIAAAAVGNPVIEASNVFMEALHLSFC
jgi:hypothetical protein